MKWPDPRSHSLPRLCAARGSSYTGAAGAAIPHQAIFDTFPKLWELAIGGRLRIQTEPVPLADVEKVWQRQDLQGRRLVLIP